MTTSGFMVMAQQPHSINIMNMPIRTFATKMSKEEQQVIAAQRDALERDLKDKIAIDKLSGNLESFKTSMQFHSNAYEAR